MRHSITRRIIDHWSLMDQRRKKEFIQRYREFAPNMEWIYIGKTDGRNVLLLRRQQGFELAN